MCWKASRCLLAGWGSIGPATSWRRPPAAICSCSPTRAAFEASGGSASVREHLVDDVALGRRIIAHGYRWTLLDGTGHVSCRMYRGFWEAVDGFSKNVFAFFEYRILFYLV